MCLIYILSDLGLGKKKKEEKKRNLLGVPFIVVQRCIAFISGSEVKRQQPQNRDVACLFRH